MCQCPRPADARVASLFLRVVLKAKARGARALVLVRLDGERNGIPRRWPALRPARAHTSPRVAG
jgi:hypothetical protein